MAELQHALDTGRLIIPLLTTGFQLAEADQFLPPAAANAVRTSQGVKFSTDFFGEAVERLVAMLKHVDLGAGGRSPDDEARARDVAESVDAEPPVTLTDLRQLEAALPDTTRTAGEAEPPPPLLPPPSPRPPQQPFPPPEEPAARPARRGLIAAAVVVGIALVAGLVFALVSSGDEDASAPTTPSAETSPPTAEPTPPTTPVRTRLNKDDSLLPGQRIESDDGRYYLELRTDGKLVVASEDDPVVWWTSKNPEPGAVAVMGNDGNFVLYLDNPPQAVEGRWVLQSDTSGRGAYLVVVEHHGGGAVVVKAEDGTELWKRPEHNGGSLSPGTEPDGVDTTAPSVSTSSSSSSSTSSTGPGGVADVQVPDVSGMPFETAERVLADSSLIAEAQAESSDVPAGTVIRTEPAEFRLAAPGSVVTVFVSDGAGSNSPST